MMNKLIALTLLTFIGCNRKENTTSNQHDPSYAEEIQSLEVVNAGGKIGAYSSILINKDSIHYSHKVNTESHHQRVSRKIKPEDWRNIVMNIDLKAFRNVKEGESMQPIDGFDKKIIITSDRDTISKKNAYDNSIWKNIIDSVNQYVKE